MTTPLQPMATVSTWYGDVDAALIEALAAIRMVMFDVDGVFSDGRIYLGNDGEEYKAFHTRDGFGVKALIEHGIKVAVITGRSSTIVETRMRALGVHDIVQGCTDKLSVFERLAEQYQLNTTQIVGVGDDIPDVALLQRAGVGIAVQDAHPWVQQQARYVTSQRGGFGAVREISDLILLSQGALQTQGGMSV